jgi:[ribosomal protein S5]-alanine N-acetyltransferase
MMELIEITEDGKLEKSLAFLPSLAEDIMQATAQMYAKHGYTPPWMGYLAVENGRCVGTCAFKGPPQNNRVEIAYFTFPEEEGRGVATRMAHTLIAIATQASPAITLAALTLPEENASTAVLRKHSFQFISELEHPEDGRVWEWQLTTP